MYYMYICVYNLQYNCSSKLQSLCIFSIKLNTYVRKERE